MVFKLRGDGADVERNKPDPLARENTSFTGYVFFFLLFIFPRGCRALSTEYRVGARPGFLAIFHDCLLGRGRPEPRSFMSSLCACRLNSLVIISGCLTTTRGDAKARERTAEDG